MNKVRYWKVFRTGLVGIFLAVSIGVKAEIITLPNQARASMMTGLYSERSEIGDRIEVRLLEPLNLRQKRTFVPLGSILSGEVVDMEEAKRGLRKGSVKVAFHTIHFPNGYFLHTEAYLTNDRGFIEDLERQEVKEPADQIEGETTWGRKALKAGKVGASALLGGSIEAAAAGGTWLFDKGSKVRIKPGDEIMIYVRDIMPGYEVQGELITSPPKPISP